MNSQELAEIRSSLGWVQQEMADSLGTGLRQYQKWEAGDAPIRPIVEKAVRNIELLAKAERAVRNTKAVQKKCDEYQASLSTCVRFFEAVGVSSSTVEALDLSIAQNKAPALAQIESAISQVLNPVQMSEFLEKMLLSMILAIDESLEESTRIKLFENMITKAFGEHDLAAFYSWAEKSYTKTSPMPAQSLYRALIRIKN